MTLLSKDQILGKEDRAHKEVDVPEWGGAVLVRPISAKDQGRFEAKMYEANKSGGTKALETVKCDLVAMCVVDEAGEPMFTAKELFERSASAVNHLFNECRKVNGMSEEDIEELEGN